MKNQALYKRIFGGITFFALLIFIVAYSIGFETIAQQKSELLYLGKQHLYLVSVSMSFALIVGITSGILLSRPCAKRWAESVIQVFNVSNTLPPLAVLALAMIFFGIGDTPAIIALFLASILPIVRSTYAGLRAVPSSLIEAANAIGMTPWDKLWRVEFPNAIPVIFSGIRIAAVINVGTAPLAFLIGASGYGELIFPGIYLDKFTILILGASATAITALALDYLLSIISRLLTPHLN